VTLEISARTTEEVLVLADGSVEFGVQYEKVAGVLEVVAFEQCFWS